MLDLSPYLGLLASIAVGTGLSGVTYLVARRTPGLVTAQTSLVATLKANSDALAARVTLLEAQVSERSAKVADLEAQVDQLRATVTDLATENAALRKRLRMPMKPV